MRTDQKSLKNERYRSCDGSQNVGKEHAPGRSAEPSSTIPKMPDRYALVRPNLYVLLSANADEILSDIGEKELRRTWASTLSWSSSDWIWPSVVDFACPWSFVTGSQRQAKKFVSGLSVDACQKPHIQALLEYLDSDSVEFADKMRDERKKYRRMRLSEWKNRAEHYFEALFISHQKGKQLSFGSSRKMMTWENNSCVFDSMISLLPVVFSAAESGGLFKRLPDSNRSSSHLCPAAPIILALEYLSGTSSVLSKSGLPRAPEKPHALLSNWVRHLARDIISEEVEVALAQGHPLKKEDNETYNWSCFNKGQRMLDLTNMMVKDFPTLMGYNRGEYGPRRNDQALSSMDVLIFDV